MAWVKFTKDFDWNVPAHRGRVTVAYKAGDRENVTRECAEAAVAAGVGEEEAEATVAAKPDEKKRADANRGG